MSIGKMIKNSFLLTALGIKRNLAGLFGAIITFAIVFLIFTLNATIKSDEDFSMHYDIPVLGNIPDFVETGKNQGKSASKSKSKARR